MGHSRTLAQRVSLTLEHDVATICRVSVFFKVDDRSVWNPSNRPGRLYVSYIRAVEEILGQQAGVDDTVPDDTIRIDSDRFVQFLGVVADEVRRSQVSPVWVALLRPVLATSLVMMVRAGIELPAGLANDAILADIAESDPGMTWP